MYGIEKMGISKIVVFVGVPLGERKSYRVSIYEEDNDKSKKFKEGLIKWIFGSDDGVHNL